MARRNRHLSIDALDYRIIQELQRSKRLDAAKVARALGANERTVRKRIERLIAADIIRLRAVLNPQALGYVTMAQILLEVEPEHEEEALSRLKAMREIAYMADGEGPRDLWIRALFKDNYEMRQFVRRTLPSLPGVTVVQSSLVPRVVRDSTEWMPRAEDYQLILAEEQTRGLGESRQGPALADVGAEDPRPAGGVCGSSVQ
jgi:DNA-binding Lrp family transcriptional regulator